MSGWEEAVMWVSDSGYPAQCSWRAYLWHWPPPGTAAHGAGTEDGGIWPCLGPGGRKGERKRILGKEDSEAERGQIKRARSGGGSKPVGLPGILSLPWHPAAWWCSEEHRAGVTRSWGLPQDPGICTACSWCRADQGGPCYTRSREVGRLLLEAPHLGSASQALTPLQSLQKDAF